MGGAVEILAKLLLGALFITLGLCVLACGFWGVVAVVG